MDKTNLIYKIESAEKVYKDLLESFFLANYPGNHLISHNLDHHRRVWGYAKELTGYADEPTDAAFIQKLIIACYLHDIGMSADQGNRHGLHSRKLCVEFLKQHLLVKSDYNDVLQAIEHHDEKEYIIRSDGNHLLNILSVADDLDAFGYTGIYRYAEIYLLRGITPAGLGNRILENASNRFRNFTYHFAKHQDLINIHQKRFEILADFFRVYISKTDTYDFGNIDPSGPCGVIEIVMNNISEENKQDNNFIEIGISSTDLFISNFFYRLQEEMT